jgi:hydroxyethylthiazole kinase-like uncharacterized protein yjeF
MEPSVMSTHTEPITGDVLRRWPLPEPGASKHSRGRVLVAGGSPSTPGAVILAGLAALRVGSGVLSLAVARSVAAATAVAVPEASVVGLALLDDDGTDDNLDSTTASCDAILIGPGLDDADHAVELIAAVRRGSPDDAQFVLDAYALGVLTEIADRTGLAGRLVLTPNADEAARLLDCTPGELGDAADADIAAAIASRFDAVVSFRAVVAASDRTVWSMTDGPPGLGTSGSGDVLAGAITGLLARGADAAQAACWGTYLHTMAGARLATRVGRLGFLAREVVAQLPRVLDEIDPPAR